MLKLNSGREDHQSLSEQFSESGIVRIENFLELNSALELSKYVENEVEFNNAFFINNENRERSDKQIGELSPQSRRELYLNIYQNAAQGIGFLYGRQKLSNESEAELGQFLELINGEHTTSLIKNITSDNSLTHADGQVTRYRVGDFLTRHIDNVPGETRKMAYVLGLSESWHPDWGGLLQLYSPQGEPLKSYAPMFNTLTLFDVNKVHSVTSIAAFAPKSRYSITGWFRA